MYREYTGIRLLVLICPFISSFFFLSNFQTLTFSSHFSQKLWGLEDWNMVHMWTVGRCIVYTGFKLLILIRPFISSFFFLSNFQTLKFFITLFWGAVRPWRLKFGTHVDSGQMYRVYRNQPAALIHPFISSFFFLSNFQTFKYFVTLFSETVWPRRLKFGTHVDSGQMYHVYRNQAVGAYSSLYFFIFLFLQFSNINIFVTLFSGTVRPRRLKLGLHVDSGQMYCVYRIQAAAIYFSLYFFIFLSLQFSNI